MLLLKYFYLLPLLQSSEKKDNVFLHSEEYKGWRGPKYLYPLSDTYFEGIHWGDPLGLIITGIVLFLFIQYKTEIKNKLII